MPEGHTLHRLARTLNRAFTGTSPQASSPQGRFTEGAAELDGAAYGEAYAHGKHLFVAFADDRWLHVHLGLIGKLTVGTVRPPYGAVRLRLATDETAGDLRGPIVCALRTGDEIAAQIAQLGPDPLRADADPDLAWARIHRSRRSIAALLMDQEILSGVGNVYRAEALFRARVDPFRPGTDLGRDTWDALWTDLVELMPLGVSTGRIDTLEPEDLEAHQSANPGRRRGRVYAYRRTGRPCYVCGSPIRTQVVDGRNLFWCAECQPGRRAH
ncbi:MAG: putative glycosylase [Friedmanniella sp.]|nr:putative glycosylase [Friedmanniella sp.]